VRNIDEKIRHHVIICGFGEFARAILKYLGTTSPPVVFVELDPELAPIRHWIRSSERSVRDQAASLARA